MEKFLITLRVLKDVLEKKRDALTRILDISQNQETILQSPPSPERASFFAQTTAEKQILIDSVKEFDEVFERFFDTIKLNLEDKKEEGREEIIMLQALISMVLELDVAIRAQELKNSLLLTPKAEPARVPTRAFRRQALDALNKHKKPGGP
jgi:hypothetical protein